MLNAVEAGLDCIEHGEFLVPGKVVEYGAGIASSGLMEYDTRVTHQLLEAGTFVSYTMQAGGYDSLVQLRARQTWTHLTSAEQARRDSPAGRNIGPLSRETLLPRPAGGA
jgi:hypothetical protein